MHHYTPKSVPEVGTRKKSDARDAQMWGEKDGDRGSEPGTWHSLGRVASRSLTNPRNVPACHWSDMETTASGGLEALPVMARASLAIQWGWHIEVLRGSKKKKISPSSTSSQSAHSDMQRLERPDMFLHSCQKITQSPNWVTDVDVKPTGDLHETASLIPNPPSTRSAAWQHGQDGTDGSSSSEVLIVHEPVKPCSE